MKTEHVSQADKKSVNRTDINCGTLHASVKFVRYFLRTFRFFTTGFFQKSCVKLTLK